MTPQAGSLAAPMPVGSPLPQPYLAAPQPGYYYAPASGPSEAAKRRTRIGDRYFAFLCLVLLGYALGGRGFAYWGINPIFVGEISLLVGVIVLIRIRMISRLLSIRAFIPVIIFMCWGAACTIPYLDKYQKDAVRDAVIWGYGTFAFIVAGLLISEPTRVQRLVLNYRKFVFWFLIIAPIVTIISSFFEEYLPVFPGGFVPIIQVKGGDMCVHLAGAFAYIVALGGGINPWVYSVFVPLNLGLNLQGRAGMVAFVLVAAASLFFKPLSARAWRMFFIIALGLFFLWATDLRVEKGGREVSAQYLVKAMSSIYSESDDDLQGTKEWRKRWWGDIINYTFHGKYFWMGKGFGINLANDDGYQVDEEEALRSPHNGHLTMLARSGVPGFSMWIFLQLTWAWLVARSYFRARDRRLTNWAGLFLFLGCYWVAFLANASFDVFLEGPMGGIWFWCIYGAGIGCVYVFRRHPGLLTPPRRRLNPYMPVG